MVKFWQSADPKKMDLQVSFARIYLLVQKKFNEKFYTAGNYACPKASDAKKRQAVKRHFETVVKIRWYMQIKPSLIRHGVALIQGHMLNWKSEIHFKCNKR